MANEGSREEHQRRNKAERSKRRENGVVRRSLGRRQGERPREGDWSKARWKPERQIRSSKPGPAGKDAKTG